MGECNCPGNHWLKREPARKFGLGMIGDVPWSTHSCLLYRSAEELLEILVPYFAKGLAENEFCVWVTADPLDAGMAQAALRKAAPRLDEYIERGQIDIRHYDHGYVGGGEIAIDRTLRGLTKRLAAAEKHGFEGLRSAGNIWPEVPWKGVIRYESLLDRMVGSKRMIVLCSYPIEKCSMREIFDVIANHDFALIKEDGCWRPFRGFGRRRLERALRESEARQRTIIDAVNDAIIALDDQNIVLSMNEAGVEMFGYDREDVIGQDIRMLLPKFDGVAKIGGADREMEARRRDGSLFPTEATITQTEHDNATLFVACVRDLSEKRHAEARLRRLHLERLAAIGGIAAGLAHELNQPLTANATYLKSAKRLLQTPSEQRRVSVEEVLDKAAEQIMRAGRIVSSLRGLAAHGEPDKLMQNLHELIRKTHEFLAAALIEAKVQVTLRLNAEKDTIVADAVQIQQVLTNLIDNAREAMTASKRRELTISTSLIDGMIQVDISDTGPGIPDLIKSRMFEPALTTKHGGMGVGLAIARMIVEAHHGRLWAQPRGKIGAVFSFTLPLAEAAPDSDRAGENSPDE
jgi:two-component system sensor kinase FixL